MALAGAEAHTRGVQQGNPQHDDGGPSFVFDVEGTTYDHDRPKITGGEIMDIAGVPRSQGLIQVHSDGTTATVAADEEVDLVPEPRFKRRPRFKRG